MGEPVSSSYEQAMDALAVEAAKRLAHLSREDAQVVADYLSRAVALGQAHPQRLMADLRDLRTMALAVCNSTSDHAYVNSVHHQDHCDPCRALGDLLMGVFTVTWRATP